MRVVRMAVLALAAAGILWSAEPNTLTEGEKAAGWRLLFDGKTLSGWDDPATRTPPGDSWRVKDGCLEAVRDPRILEDLITAKRFGDFELMFDWKLEPGGNSGVKYRITQQVFIVHEKPGYLDGRRGERAALRPEQRGQTYVIGFEFQLIDDEKHADALRGPERRTGALYYFQAPSESAEARAGEWQTSRLVVKGASTEHWVNGKRVLAANLDDAKIQEGVLRRAQNDEAFAKKVRESLTVPSPIALQNHGDSAVWFRSVKIRELR